MLISALTNSTINWDTTRTCLDWSKDHVFALMASVLLYERVIVCVCVSVLLEGHEDKPMLLNRYSIVPYK